MNDEDLYKKARKKVQAKKGFFYHFLAYAFVVGMLYAIMHYENDGAILPVIVVALSWGIGIATHYFKVFGTEHLDFIGINPNWEEEELTREIEKLKQKRELKERLRKERDLLDNLEGPLDLKEIEKRPLDDESHS